MSKLIKCKACGKEIAKGAKKCVHCGKDQRNFFMRHKISTFLLVAFILGITVLSTEENSTTLVDNNISLDDYKKQCVTISYDDIAREPDKYEGRKIIFTGKIIQTQETGSNIKLRINVTKTDLGFYEDTIWVNYKYLENQKRLLEDDVVNIWGEVEGLKSYTTIFGAEVTIPEINARSIEILNLEKE